MERYGKVHTMRINSILLQANSYIEDAERLLSVLQNEYDTINELERAQEIETIKHTLQETRRSLEELKGSIRIKPELEGSGITNDQQQRIRTILYHFLQNDNDVNDLIEYYNNKTDWIDQIGWNTFFSDTDGIYMNKIRLLTTSYLIRDQEEEG